METMSLKFNTIIMNPSPRRKQTTQIPATPPPRLTLNAGKQRRLAAGRCVAENRDSPAAVLAAAEIMTDEEEEELKQVRRPKKCKETEGTAELLECLEKEAIMGEDEGRDPKDYDRRAKIFDKSSRMFRALKEQRNHNSSE